MNHAACTHERTPAGRAACRREGPQDVAAPGTPARRTSRQVTTVDAPAALTELLATAKERGYATTRVGYVDDQGVVNILSPTGTLIYGWLLADPDQNVTWFRPLRTSVAHRQASLAEGTRKLLAG